MGRDLTPVEYFYLNERNKGRGHSAFDVMESTCWKINGVSHPLHSKEEMALRRQYPLFGYLLNTFPKTHEALSKVPGGLDLLKNREEELSVYIKTGAGDRDSAMIKWFEGELDSSFYYSERNEEMFVESLMDDAKALARKPLDAQISSAASRAKNFASEEKSLQNDIDR